MLVRDGSSGLDDLSSECEGKQTKIKASFFPFPLSGHQKVQLTFRVILLVSDNLRSRKSYTEVPSSCVLVDSRCDQVDNQD